MEFFWIYIKSVVWWMGVAFVTVVVGGWGVIEFLIKILGHVDWLHKWCQQIRDWRGRHTKGILIFIILFSFFVGNYLAFREAKIETRMVTKEIEGIRDEKEVIQKEFDEYKKLEKPSITDIHDLVDACRWDFKRTSPGDYGSCKKIFDLAEEYPNDEFIKAQKKHIVDLYTDLSMVKSLFPPMMPSNDENGRYIYGLQLKTSDLQENSKYTWCTSANGAYLLRYRPEKSVPKRLVDLIQNSSSAFVKEIAIDSYCHLTEYEKNGIFDIDGVVAHYIENSVEIVGKMAEDGSIAQEPKKSLNAFQLHNIGYIQCP